MSVDPNQLEESIGLAEAKAKELHLRFSAEANQTDRVQYIWLEGDVFACEIFIFLDSEFVDFSILGNGDQLQFDGPFDQSRIVSEKVSVILDFLERTVSKSQA